MKQAKTDYEPPSSFLQSDEWEEFQRAVGRRTGRVAGALVIHHELPGGNHYLYSPRLYRAGNNFEHVLERYARDNGSLFAKVDFLRPIDVDGENAFESHAIQPSETIHVDINPSESYILGNMHEKTRYNIRLAEKKGVAVSVMLAGFETLYPLLEDTAKREGFRLHPKRYYETLLSISSRDFFNRVLVAHFKGEPLAAALVNFHVPSKTVTYLHGGSSRSHRELMAPYMLQWETIREGKRRGFSTYDLWGINAKRWPGVTRFKEGFRGVHVGYPGAVDLVYKPAWYLLYRALRRMRRPKS